MSVKMKYQVYTERNFKNISYIKNLSPQTIEEIDIVSRVLPFRVNNFVLNELINWNKINDDPIFRLVFPCRDMLPADSYDQLKASINQYADGIVTKKLVYAIRNSLNPHPAGQQQFNIPQFLNDSSAGIQHKYAETVLFFPSAGQTCHSYCTFCFRWAQFVGDKHWRMAESETEKLINYLQANQHITDILITGGDPLVMKTKRLADIIEKLLQPALAHIKTIRIGTKALTYWPYRFLTDDDAADLLRLFTKVSENGKQLAFMAHYNHWRELESQAVEKAIKAIQAAGAIIRSQGPILNHINNDPDVWKIMWEQQINKGIVPYYMFLERNTGAYAYFAVPIAKAYHVYQQAARQISGLARTARGPVMSTLPGKVEVLGITNIADQQLFNLRFIQARQSNWCYQPFFAKFDQHATWFTDLQPGFNQDEFFYAKELTRSTNFTNHKENTLCT